MHRWSASFGLALLASSAAGCLIDRSSLGSDRDAGDPTTPDAFALDAPGLDARLPSDLDAPSSIDDDAFVAEGTDAWAPVPDDAWSPPLDAGAPCVPTSETCNAHDDDCNGQIDEVGCSIASSLGDVSCVGFVHGTHVYQVCKSTTTAPWEGALMACRFFAPYDLVRIDDNLENAAVSAHVIESRAWIGLNDRVTEGTFVWADGSALGYDSWARMEPGTGVTARAENCVAMDARSPLWRDAVCGALDLPSFGTDIASFVCEAAIRP